MEYGVIEVPLDYTTLVFSIILLLPGILFAFLSRKTKNKYYFIASSAINLLTILLLVVLVPLIHTNDNCEIKYSHGSGVGPEVYNAGAPCIQAADLFFPILLGISLGIFITGLIIMIKTSHQKTLR